jgi:hypothetical protein
MEALALLICLWTFAGTPLDGAQLLGPLLPPPSPVMSLHDPGLEAEANGALLSFFAGWGVCNGEAMACGAAVIGLGEGDEANFFAAGGRAFGAG